MSFNCCHLLTGLYIFCFDLIIKLYFTANYTNMVKVATGFVIFRLIASEIEYLLLQTSYGIHHWTPPKGIAKFYFL